ncbi:response regulator [Candidatus Poribacteria bacterium]|nr:response regulator [Candidatus Poribacteria bacterium]MYB00942.1 response regulator [Candidatus Poribacteria bacterium]
MKKFFKPLPDLEERLDQVNERVRRARRTLDWRTREARIPLDIQEDFGVSELQGDVMLVSRDDYLRNKVRNLIRSEGYGCDFPERSSEAVGMLKMRKYQMIIADYTRRSRGRLFEYVKRYQPHIKIVSIVRNNDEGRRVMRAGSYSYLLGRGFDPEQLRTCIISALKLKHRACWLLTNGERCNRSCVDDFQSDEDFAEIE